MIIIYGNTNAYFQNIQQLVLDEGQLPFLPVFILDVVGQNVQGRIDRLIGRSGPQRRLSLFRERRAEAAAAAAQDDECRGGGRERRERFHAGDRLRSVERKREKKTVGNRFAKPPKSVAFPR